MNTKHFTIMFTDMKGFTEKTSVHSRSQLHYLLELQDNLIKPAIRQFEGRIVKTIGDAFLVAFESPTDAVLCGMKIQENVINHNARAASSDQFDIRIAINSGEVNVRDNDIFGEAVNITSRIESIAEPNEVYFTEAVYLSMNRNEIPTAEVGYRRLKGIPEEIKIYKVLTEQTNLIRMKMRRQEMAKNNANLAKDEQNFSLINQSNLAAIPTPVSKKGFWQRHSKKIIIGGIALLMLLFIMNINKNKKEESSKEPEITKLTQALEEKNKMLTFKNEFDQALQDNNKARIDEMLQKINDISMQELPLEAKKIIGGYLNEKKNDSNLGPLQKRKIEKILDNLK